MLIEGKCSGEQGDDPEGDRSCGGSDGQEYGRLIKNPQCLVTDSFRDVDLIVLGFWQHFLSFLDVEISEVEFLHGSIFPMFNLRFESQMQLKKAGSVFKFN